jgi:hypothetical protein
MLARIGRSANDLYKLLDPWTFSKGYAAGYLIAFFTLVVHAIAATSFTSIRTMECFILMTGFTLCLAHHREAWRLGGLQKPIDRDPIFLPAIEPLLRPSWLVGATEGKLLRSSSVRRRTKPSVTPIQKMSEGGQGPP